MATLFVTPQQKIISTPVDLTATTVTTGYTCPRDGNKLAGVLVSSSGLGAATISVRWSVGGSTAYDLIVDYSIADNTNELFDFGPLRLASGDLITLQAGTADKLHAVIHIAEAGSAQGGPR